MISIAEITGHFSRSIMSTQEGDVLTLIDEKMNHTIVITVGSKEALVNGEVVAMNTEAVKDNAGAVLIEYSALKILLDAEAKYQEEITAVYITESGLC